MQQEGFDTELSKVFFVSCFKQDYSIHFKQKANQLLSNNHASRLLEGNNAKEGDEK